MAALVPEQPVISADVAQFFEDAKLLTPVIERKRKVSTSMISPPSTIPSISSSASTVSRVSRASFSAAYVSQQSDEIEIPADLRSAESYEFLGFTYGTAVRLWNRYLSQPEGMNAGFYDFAVWHVEEPERTDVYSNEDDWRAFMETLGVGQKLQNAILLPEFADLRGTASCKFWILDAMGMKWRALQALNDDLRMQQVRIQHRKKPAKTGRPKAGSILSVPSLPNPSGRKEGGRATSNHPESALLLSTNDLERTSDSIVETAFDAPLNLDRHTMLWRAGDRRKHQAFYNESSGHVELAAIATSPGDFSGRNSVGYFTPQREVADRYAQWSKHKAEIALITILQVAVPSSFVESLDTEYLWFGDVWKQVVWWSRRGLTLPNALKDLKKKALFIGHIATGIHDPSPEDIKESALLKVRVEDEEKRAIQWTFRGEDVEEAFNRHCHGKVWIHSLGALCIPKQSE